MNKNTNDVVLNDSMERVKAQLVYRRFGRYTGSGKVIQRRENGPFIVYSRIDIMKLTDEINTKLSTRKCLDEMKIIFLMGPTPAFFGELKATTSWRREFVNYLTDHSLLDDRFMVVLPEPEECDWSKVDFPLLKKREEHIYAQELEGGFFY